MNKTEKIICLFLGLALVWCFMSGKDVQPPKDVEKDSGSALEQKSEELSIATNNVSSVTNAVNAAVPSVTNGTNVVALSVSQTNLTETVNAESASKVKLLPEVPEEIFVLENDDLKLELTSWGAGVKNATLKRYAKDKGEIGDDNPPVELDYSQSPLGTIKGLKGFDDNAGLIYGLKEKGDDHVVFTNGESKIERKITLKSNYKVVFEDSFGDASLLKDGNSMSMGVMTMGKSSNDMLSIDGLREGEVLNYGTDDDVDSKLFSLLAGDAAGGCSCSGPREVGKDDPVGQSQTIEGKHDWIALKNRFFVTSLVGSSQDNKGFKANVNRNIDLPVYRPYDAGVDVLFGGEVEKRTTEFYIGPKEQALLADNEMKEVMEFGFWSFLCYPMVWILNFFHSLIPNYGVAIILLTILVRLVFWPLTRKSTEGMKKMQEIQPLLKELQAKFKDNPQRLQQETWALYREKKVNPLSSCLPMLIQIPIFIALFNVLRSMVELRYASFLWIDDLSAPEHLFASVFPFGGLNILPILMAATMYLQSRLTPSAGDPNQQRMMTLIMPIMMLVMFYNFASALSLYWTVSQILSIIQMWMMRRETARKAKVLEPEVIDPPSPTRQMRRHS